MHLSKNNISTDCNSLKECLVKENIDEKHNGLKIELETNHTNWMFVLLNIFYLITALLVLAAGATVLFIYSSNGPKFELNLVCFLWIVSGAGLLFVSIFGIIGACKNSVAWINIYSILMSVVFLIQLSASITGYALISESECIANATLHNFIYKIESFEASSVTIVTMDFIQKSFQCCGVQSPNDWGEYDDSFYHDAPKQRTPQSCCTSGSDYTNGICDSYYQNGCIVEMTELTSQIMLTIYFIGLTIAVVQIIGIVSAFVFAKMIRTTKSDEGI